MAQVSGADESSLYVEVTAVEGDEIVCVAKNGAVLSGLLTLVHSRRPGPMDAPTYGDTLVDLPLLSETDVLAMRCAVPPLCSPGCRCCPRWTHWQ